VGRIEIITLKRSIRPPDPGRRDTGKVILLANGIIVMAGSVYASTHSVAATAVAGCAGLSSVVVYVWRKLRPASLAIYETTRNRPSRLPPSEELPIGATRSGVTRGVAHGTDEKRL